MGDCKLKCSSCGKEVDCESDSCSVGTSCCGAEMGKVCENHAEDGEAAPVEEGCAASVEETPSEEKVEGAEEQSENGGGGCCG